MQYISRYVRNFIEIHGENAKNEIEKIVKKFNLNINIFNVNRLNSEYSDNSFHAACLNDNSVAELVEALETHYVGNESDWSLSTDEALTHIEDALTIMAAEILDELYDGE